MKFQPPSLQEVIRHRPLLHYGTADVVERLLEEKNERRVQKG